MLEFWCQVPDRSTAYDIMKVKSWRVVLDFAGGSNDLLRNSRKWYRQRDRLDDSGYTTPTDYAQLNL